MLARHLIGLFFCSEKATRQLCLHLSRFTRVLMVTEDIFLVVDACRRAVRLSAPLGQILSIDFLAVLIWNYARH